MIRRMLLYSRGRERRLVDSVGALVERENKVREAEHKAKYPNGTTGKGPRLVPDPTRDWDEFDLGDDDELPITED